MAEARVEDSDIRTMSLNTRQPLDSVVLSVVLAAEIEVISRAVALWSPCIKD
jgi:hypothetical protein